MAYGGEVDPGLQEARSPIPRPLRRGNVSEGVVFGSRIPFAPSRGLSALPRPSAALPCAYILSSRALGDAEGTAGADWLHRKRSSSRVSRGGGLALGQRVPAPTTCSAPAPPRAREYSPREGRRAVAWRPVISQLRPAPRPRRSVFAGGVPNCAPTHLTSGPPRATPRPPRLRRRGYSGRSLPAPRLAPRGAREGARGARGPSSPCPPPPAGLVPPSGRPPGRRSRLVSFPARAAG